jgi:cytochrome o ubiquinol oxidase subunit 2
VLDDKAYMELSKQSIAVKPSTYRSFTPDLFQDVINQVLPPGPGPVPEVSPKSSERAEK